MSHEISEKCFLPVKESLKKADQLLGYIRILDDIDPKLVSNIISPYMPRYVKKEMEEAIKHQIVNDEDEFIISRTKHDLYQWHEGLVREALGEFIKCECNKG